MQLLTMNVHSFLEEGWQEKQHTLINTLARLQPDVIALQEVNQPMKNPLVFPLSGLFAQYGIPLKEGNYGLQVARGLWQQGCDYTFVWVGIKQGYGKYDEGLCFLTRFLPLESTAFTVSETTDPTNWRKRMVLGMRGEDTWFYNVHFGRWDDPEDPFENQWLRFVHSVDKNQPMFVMGDFNAPHHVPGQGYDRVLSTGFQDTYTLAQQKDEGVTAFGTIDGWEDQPSHAPMQRIDYIFTNHTPLVLSSQTLFNGTNGAVLSDHFAVTVTYQTKGEIQ